MRWARQSRDEGGVTLVELCITIVILAMISGALTASFITAFNSMGSNSARVNQSNDVQLIAGFLVRDAQNAGGTDPATAAVDTSIGVSTTDAAGCEPDSSLILRFSWIDHVTATSSITRVANYFLNAAHEIVRKTCASDGSESSLTLARAIEKAEPTCDPGPACTANLPDTVKLTLTSTVPTNGTAISYELTASLRPQAQIPPTSTTSTMVPTIVAPASLADWTVNRDYPGTAMIASAGMTPYAWSATGLPPGLGINGASGVVTGTPTATGVFTPTITLTDAVGFTDTLTLPPLSIAKTPEITGPVDLPDWTRGQDYPLQTMTWQDGTAPFTWAASGLPTGLSINPTTGEITGIPTASLTFTPSVTVTDNAGASATKTYTVKINPPPGIATAALPPAEVGLLYNTTVAPTGGTPPLTWSLPPPKPVWLSINSTPAGGRLFGTPPAAGEPDVTVRVTDAANASAQKTYSLTIADAVKISGPGALTETDWTINRDYPGIQITGANGVGSYAWSATGLPPGMSINANTGVITGTPTATGTFTITARVVDDLGGNDTQSYTLVIHQPPTITTASLPNGQEGIAYSTVLDANLGTTPYTWAGSGLPAGLSVNAATGVLSGTPTLSGTFSVTITVTDHAGASFSRTLTLSLNGGPSVGGTLPDWTVGVPYPNPQITGSSGTPPYTYSATGLPAGLSIGAGTGIVSGTPTAAGAASVVVTVTDSVGGTSTQSYSLTINPAPDITTPGPLPDGAAGSAYPNTPLSRTGGTAPFSWSATGLPAGMSIAAGTGVISGTPTVGGAFSVDVTLTDSTGATAPQTYSLTIDSPLTITTTSLSQGQSPINFQLLATGGTLPYSWSMSGGPAWATLGADGVLSGDPPAVAATFTFTVGLTDAGGASTSTTFTLTIT